MSTPPMSSEPSQAQKEALAGALKATIDYLAELGIKGNHIAMALMCAGIDGLSTYRSIPEIVTLAEGQATALAANQAAKVAH